MTAHGEIGLKSRRPSTPGANTQILYNQGGVDGASQNLFFDFVNNSLNVIGNARVTQNLATANITATQNITAASITLTTNIAAGNIFVTQNIATGNLSVPQNTATGNLSVPGNGDFGNITTANITASLNGTFGNIATGNLTASQNANVNGYIAVHGSFPPGGVVGISTIVNTVIGGTYVGAEAFGNLQTIQMFTANAALDNAWWEINAQNTGVLQFRTSNDTYGNIATWLQVVRANANSNIGTIQLGNAQDRPNLTVLGNVITTSNMKPGNLAVTQNSTTGNLVATGNINAAFINASTVLSTNGYFVTRGGLPGFAIETVQPGGVFIGSQALGNLQCIEFYDANSSTDNGWWEIITQNTGFMQFRAASDTYANISIWLQAQRANANSNIGTISIGNAQDLPNITAYGNVITTSNVLAGNLIVAQNATTGNLAVAGNITATNMFTSQLSDVGLIITPNTLVIRTSAGSNANLFLGANGVSFINIGNTQWMNIAGQINVTNTISIAGINISTIFSPSYYNYAGGV